MPKSQNVYKDTRNPFLLLILMIPIRNLMNMIEHHRWDHYTQIHVKQAHLQIKNNNSHTLQTSNNNYSEPEIITKNEEYVPVSHALFIIIV